jgi:hypothetical protein
MRIKSDNFLHINWINRLHRLVLIVLGIVLIVNFNYLASKHFLRKDYTSQHRYSLSAESLAYIRQVPGIVEIIVTIPSNSQNNQIKGIYEDIRNLLREYESASVVKGTARIQVEFVNIYQNRKRAEAIAAKYGITQDNSIVVVSGAKNKQILCTDLYELQKGGKKLFKGEQAFTSAILDVTRNKRQKLYFTVGHGEMDLNNVSPTRGLSEVKQALSQYNFDLAVFNLGTTDVPEDCDLMIIAAPQVGFLDYEVERLRNYLSKRQGRLIVLLNAFNEHGLDELFYDWGLLVDDAVIIDTEKELELQGGDMMIKRFIRHPITQFLIDYQLGILCGFCRPVRLDPAAFMNEQLSTTVLMATSDKSWAKNNYQQLENLAYNPAIDLKGPVSIAALSSLNIGSQVGLKLAGGRLVVFGNADFVSNTRLNVLGNKILFLNSINWCLDFHDSLNIPPRPVEHMQILLTHADFVRLAGSILGIALSFGLLGGILVYWRHRH